MKDLPLATGGVTSIHLGARALELFLKRDVYTFAQITSKMPIFSLMTVVGRERVGDEMSPALTEQPHYYNPAEKRQR